MNMIRKLTIALAMVGVIGATVTVVSAHAAHNKPFCMPVSGDCP